MMAIDLAATAVVDGPANCSASKTDWKTLDLKWDSCSNFVLRWASWRLDPKRCARLHYVAIASQPPELSDLRLTIGSHPECADLVAKFAPRCKGLEMGFHRMSFDGSAVMLTLCIGDPVSLLKEQDFIADEILLDSHVSQGESEDSKKWLAKALTKSCRRGTKINGAPNDAAMRRALTEAGFQECDPTRHQGLSYIFNPCWQPKIARRKIFKFEGTQRSCVVIGAGLAGASIAASLARRGWTVKVLDAAEVPAGGASGLPAGLLVPHTSMDDCPLSRLSRAGMRMTILESERTLVADEDWGCIGALELRHIRAETATANTDNHEPGALACDTNCLIATDQQHDTRRNSSALWHANAAWIKPAKLVEGWLRHPRITFQGNSCVNSFQRSGDEWLLFDSSEQLLASANIVVLASAIDCLRLYKQTQEDPAADSDSLAVFGRIQATSGQVSWSPQTATDDLSLPSFAVNGRGSLIPSVPIGAGKAWFVGATFDAPGRPARSVDDAHLLNFQRLATLLPSCADGMAERFRDGVVKAWGSSRCTTADRLPLVGPLQAGSAPTVWVSTGFGSRGLTMAVLCAEIIAARLCSEPLPIEASLCRSLDSFR